jgi:hypothetical protein
MNADMEARYTLALSEGRVITDNEAQLSLLLSVILRHLPFLHMNHGALDTDPEVDDLAGRGALAQEMRATGFSDWADRLENRRVRTRLLDAANDAAIDLLMGRAAGRYFSANMNPGMIPIVDNVFMAFPDAWRDFGEMACHDIRNDSARKLELLKFTSERVALFEDNITNGDIPRYRHHAKELIDFYKSAPRLKNVWHEQPHDAIIETDDELFFDVLRLCNPVEFLKILDDFSHPQVGRSILQFSDRMCLFGDMLMLFELSPSAFNKEKWNESAKTPMLLLQAIGRKLAHIAISNDVADIGAAEAQPPEAFKVAVHSIFDILMARGDKEQLGFSWLEYLVDLGGLERRRRAEDDKRLLLCYHFLIIELAKKLLPHPFGVAWVKEQEMPWRYSRAVTVIAVAALGKNGGAEQVKDILKCILHKNFLSSGSTKQFIAPGQTPQRVLIGHSLAVLDNISGFFDGLWKSLSQLRDRSRHLESAQYERAGIADELLISWFLCAAEFLNPDNTEARPLWLSLLGAVREMALTQGVLGEDLLTTYYKFLAGLMALRLGRPENGVAREDLKEFLSPFIWPDRNLPRILIMLRDMGTPASIIRAAITNLPRVIDLLKKFIIDEIEIQKRFEAAHMKPKESLVTRVEVIIAELLE